MSDQQQPEVPLEAREELADLEQLEFVSIVRDDTGWWMDGNVSDDTAIAMFTRALHALSCEGFGFDIEDDEDDDGEGGDDDEADSE